MAGFQRGKSQLARRLEECVEQAEPQVSPESCIEMCRFSKGRTESLRDAGLRAKSGSVRRLVKMPCEYEDQSLQPTL